MKRFLILPLLTLAFSLPAKNIIVNSSSTIKAVTIYRQYANIERAATIKVPAGQSEIILEDLSNNIDYRSLQVQVPNGLLLLSAAQQLNHLVVKKKTDKILMVEDSLDAIDLRLKLLLNQVNALTDEESLLLQNKEIRGNDNGVSSEELKAIADLYRHRLLEVKNKRTMLQVRERKIREHLATFQSQLAELNANLNKPTGEIVLQVQAERAMTADIKFSYLVTSAYWTPSYNVRVTDLANPVELLYKANVVQNTGIDWENVNVTINTGNPSLGLERPKLAVWHIDFGTSGVYAQSGRGNTYAVTNMAKASSGDAELNNNGFFSLDNFIQTQNNAINTSFRIDLKYTIPSDNRTHVVLMKEYELPAVYTYHTVPKLDEDAFLLAKVTDWESLSLLPGPANVFMEDAYVGQSNIDPYNTNDTMLLSLGRDKQVVVDCQAIKEFTKTRTFGLKKTQTFGYEVTVHNTKGREIEVEVLKNIPISNNDDITVELEEYEGARYTKELGKLVWNLRLKPGETKKIRMVYSVKYPKNKTIANL